MSFFNMWTPDPREHFYGHHFHVHYNISSQAYELRATLTEPGMGDQRYRAKVEWEKIEEFTQIEPAFVFQDSQHESPMQSLFECLWAAGFRPAKGVANNDEVVKAKDENIGDLRRVIDKLFDKMFDT